MTRGVVAVRADQGLGREIHVVDTTVVIGRDDALGDRLQRVLGLALAARQGNLEALAVTDVARDRQDGAIPAIVDSRALRLDPQARLVAVDELHLDAARHGLARQPLGHVLAKQRAVRRLHEIGDFPARKLHGLHADEGRGRLVGQQDLLVVNEDNLGQSVCKIPEQAIAPLDFLVTFAQRVEQAIDRMRELRRLGVIRNRQPVTDRGVARCLERLLVETRHARCDLASRDPQVDAAPGCHQGQD